ncbi:hypothetical protein BWI75_07710 [Gloeocapsopsis sp. AAB1 = 1H9]|uniref:Uncharacterized protein n=2 Tax=Gloeocapsopsis TaxID=693222 RepID=A0A6N8FT09_9CHRO|nr:hypothetical protein [Gloeocapsopsis dulcis AAB1 = 1H9]
MQVGKNYDSIDMISTAQSIYPDCMPETTSVQTTWSTTAAPYLDTRLEEPGSGWCEAGRDYLNR